MSASWINLYRINKTETKYNLLCCESRGMEIFLPGYKPVGKLLYISQIF